MIVGVRGGLMGSFDLSSIGMLSLLRLLSRTCKGAATSDVCPTATLLSLPTSDAVQLFLLLAIMFLKPWLVILPRVEDRFLELTEVVEFLELGLSMSSELKEDLLEWALPTRVAIDTVATSSVSSPPNMNELGFIRKMMLGLSSLSILSMREVSGRAL